MCLLVGFPALKVLKGSLVTRAAALITCPILSIEFIKSSLQFCELTLQYEKVSRGKAIKSFVNEGGAVWIAGDESGQGWESIDVDFVSRWIHA